MGVKITVKKRIVVNGVEYGSPEEMPPDLRAAWERAAAGQGVHVSGKVTFNGRTYDAPEAMPPEVRKLCEDALAAAGDAAPGSAPVLSQEPPPPAPVNLPSDVAGYSAPIVPGASGVRKWLLAAAGLGLLLFLLWLVTHAAGRP
jgi:hypothetical protein